MFRVRPYDDFRAMGVVDTYLREIFLRAVRAAMEYDWDTRGEVSALRNRSVAYANDIFSIAVRLESGAAGEYNISCIACRQDTRFSTGMEDFLYALHTRAWDTQPLRTQEQTLFFQEQEEFTLRQEERRIQEEFWTAVRNTGPDSLAVSQLRARLDERLHMLRQHHQGRRSLDNMEAMGRRLRDRADAMIHGLFAGDQEVVEEGPVTVTSLREEMRRGYSYRSGPQRGAEEVAPYVVPQYRQMWERWDVPTRTQTPEERRAEALAREVQQAIYAQAQAARDAAQIRGLKLLKENLTPAQLAEYKQHNYFHVIGGSSGKTYRIKHGRQQNILELDGKGAVLKGWCFLPAGNLVEGDVMLAQKLALELQEKTALKIAHAFVPYDELRNMSERNRYHAMHFMVNVTT